MTSERVVKVLAAHDYALGLRAGSICICGHVPVGDPSSLRTQQDHHRAHLAEALAPLLAEVRAEALREAAEDMVWDFDGDVSRAAVRSWLSDLADREQVPGERREEVPSGRSDGARSDAEWVAAPECHVERARPSEGENRSGK